jgi:hypothetical protein
MVRMVGPGADKIAELGVYEGECAEFCSATLKPLSHTLVDLWDYDRYDVPLDTPQAKDVQSVFKAYFGGDPKAALENAFIKVRERFSDRPNVEILRADIAEAADRFADGSFDFIYLDGNHMYEQVLRDLYKWFPKLKKGGLFVCNDFDESVHGAKHNLGVIPAFVTFSKRVPVYPIALSSEIYGDLYFSNQDSSAMIDRFVSNIIWSDCNAVQISNAMLGSYFHRMIEGGNLGRRAIPSFGLS